MKYRFYLSVLLKNKILSAVDAYLYLTQKNDSEDFHKQYILNEKL